MSFDIAIIVSTFERPAHLERCLASLDAQRGVDGRFEVVVTDDGSRDGTLVLLREMAGRVRYPLSFTTHDHDGFRLARCRNEGAAASTAPYLLFTDGDCVLPADHVLVHLRARRPGVVIGSDCARLDAGASARVDPARIRDGGIGRLVPIGERLRLLGKAMRAKTYEAACVPMRPRLSGNNISLWRRDFERVNGFDERFVGWGHEDRDLQERLERIGLRVRSVLWSTAPVHLWHPPAPTFSRNGEGTENHRYFMSSNRPTFCVDGLVKPGSQSSPRIVPVTQRGPSSLAPPGRTDGRTFAGHASGFPSGSVGCPDTIRRSA